MVHDGYVDSTCEVDWYKIMLHRMIPIVSVETPKKYRYTNISTSSSKHTSTLNGCCAHIKCVPDSRRKTPGDKHPYCISGNPTYRCTNISTPSIRHEYSQPKMSEDGRSRENAQRSRVNTTERSTSKPSSLAPVKLNCLDKCRLSKGVKSVVS